MSHQNLRKVYNQSQPFLKDILLKYHCGNLLRRMIKMEYRNGSLGFNGLTLIVSCISESYIEIISF